MSEKRELADLRDDAIGWAAASARARFRDRAGLRPEEETGAAARAQAWPLASSRDGLAQVCEVLAAVDPEEKPGRAARLSGLRTLLVQAYAQALDPGAFDELSAVPTRALVELPGDPGLHGKLAPRAVEREIWPERSRQKRADQEAALADALGRFDGVRAAAWEATQAALGELGAGEPGEAAARLHLGAWALPPAGGATAPVAAAAAITATCDALLRATDDLAGDLLAWLLERQTGARPHPGGAERHDLLQLIHAPRCAPAFPRGELLRTCRRWAEGLRLDLAAGGDVRVDEDDRPLKQAGASAELLEPGEVRLSLLPAEGPRVLAELLGALSVAQLRAGPPADAPGEDFFCGDPAVLQAGAALLGGLVRDPLFRRRCAKAELGPDDGRAIAVGLLVSARLAAARALAALEAHREGLGARAGTLHRELWARAALVQLPAGLSLEGLDPLLSGWDELRALCLAARARLALRERFDEDFWRNPHALPALRGLWTRGGRPTLRELWQEIGPGEEPSLGPLLAELAECCS